jgi:hypothetical protein
MWWLSAAWFFVSASVTNILVWTPLLLEAALAGTFDGRIVAVQRAPLTLREQVGAFLGFQDCHPKAQEPNYPALHWPLLYYTSQTLPGIACVTPPASQCGRLRRGTCLLLHARPAWD